MLRDILLPLVSLASGLVSLFIDPKTDRAKAWIVIAVLAASAIATGFYGYQDEQAQAQEVLQASQREEGLQRSIDSLTGLLQSAGVLARKEGDSDTTSSNLAPDQPMVPIPNNAKPISNAPPVPSGQKPVIQYFAKSTDNDAVSRALRNGGFEFVKVPGQRAESTNCIWIGDAVSLADIKSVATALVRGGVPLRVIRRFRESSGPKANLIEIGADRALVNAPVLTADQIQNMSELPARDATAKTKS